MLLYLSSHSVRQDGTVLCISLYPAVLRKPQTLLVYCTSLLLFPLKLGHFSCSVSSNNLKWQNRWALCIKCCVWIQFSKEKKIYRSFLLLLFFLNWLLCIRWRLYNRFRTLLGRPAGEPSGSSIPGMGSRDGALYRICRELPVPGSGAGRCCSADAWHGQVFSKDGRSPLRR